MGERIPPVAAPENTPSRPNVDQIFVVYTTDSPIEPGRDQVTLLGFVVAEYHPDGAVRWTRGDTKQAIDMEIARHMSGHGQKNLKGWRRIDFQDWPTKETFYRAALRDLGDRIGYDMDHARVLHLRTLKDERAMAFPDLDAQWMKAFATGDKATADAVEAKRQALRDVPVSLASAIDGASTVEELKAITLPE